jgi:membrane-bound lytic murein transglycosylase B
MAVRRRIAVVTPAALAALLVHAHAAALAATGTWSGVGAVPPALAAAAFTEQRIELRLSDDPRLAARVLAQLPSGVGRDVRDDVLAHRELAMLTPPRPLRAFRVGRAAPAAGLLRFYREGQARSGVPWRVLAAVNYVESDFGRLRNASVSGAQGPMQFMPSTWRAYGRGDVHDPHAAILAAARFLRAAGAALDLRAALYRYNPSPAYVDAILRLAGRIRRDERAFLVFYARRLIVRTPSGYRRLNSKAPLAVPPSGRTGFVGASARNDRSTRSSCCRND